MALLFPGVLIRRERLRRSWSQEGLCRGICAVSYLSKIEQGKAEASGEVLRLLMARLELPWLDGPETLAAAQMLIERCYEAVFACDERALESLRPEFAALEAGLRYSPCAPDAALLAGLLARPQRPAGAELEPFFDQRQLGLQRMLQGRHEEALRLYPCAYLYLKTGIDIYEQGSSDAMALEHLHRAYELAAEGGYAHTMLLAKLFMGNCYCNAVDLDNMEKHYKVAERLARALRNPERLRDVGYNRAAAQLEAGDIAPAYAWFSSVKEPTALELHKLAICCEKLGRRAEALAALEKADALAAELPYGPLVVQGCGLVRCRLEHPDYLQCPEYGEQLLDFFVRCRSELPVGYASFHLPWVLEWHTAARQYRAAYELLRGFPTRPLLKRF